MLKNSSGFTVFRLETFWTGTRLVLTPFLISTIQFLILTNAFWNGSVFACSSAAEMKRVATELFVIGQNNTT